MESIRKVYSLFLFVFLLPSLLFGQAASRHNPSLEIAQEKSIGFSVNPADGSYTIFDPASAAGLT